MRSVFDCSLYELNKSHDPEGNLTFIYENVHVPFPSIVFTTNYSSIFYKQ